MTPPGSLRSPSQTGLLEKLLAAVRPEFRVDVYLPAPDDLVLGRPSCAVPGYDRSGWEYGFAAHTPAAGRTRDVRTETCSWPTQAPNSTGDAS